MGGKSSKQPLRNNVPEAKARLFHSLGKNTLDIAITGESGAGKSSLINALRGMINDNQIGAAVTDVIESTMEPMAYVHPGHPEVTLWDLPGIGTNTFTAKEYVKEMNFHIYDFFIIVAKERFTEIDATLAHEIQRIKKSFFYVRTNLDFDMNSERRNPHFSEDKTLEKVRENCCENLRKTGESSPRVFLISRWDLKKFDFESLEKALWDECDKLKRHTSTLLLDQERKRCDKSSKPSLRAILGGAISRAILKIDLKELKTALEKMDIQDVIAQSLQELDLLERTTLDIAITGQSGAGKSSLVNALRDMTDFEGSSAETGVVQTTMEVKEYQHPLFPKVTIWDLPGIGTPEFKADEYLKKVDFKKYDFFIIVASGRFTEQDTKLACEIQKMGKRFYYVRTKVDVSIDSESKKQNFSEEKTLEKIRNYCCDNLKNVGESSPRVFLISRWDLSLYDFPFLHDTLEKDLDDLKRHALITAMPAFSSEMLTKKKAAMEALIWKLALVSCFIGAVPVLGLSFVCDIGILVGAMIHLCKVFGLDEASLRSLANRVGKPIHELKSAIKNTPGISEISKELVVGLLSKSLLYAPIQV
ncbi:interferon-gamma-inducible GTPase 10-like isoform X2 [Elgaria multicarinata webbii]|uniref:interferon-gamma-inducible GTPase 10-like isoform X2 n=1 Tax=Elgaria multicarinata webbii TaxID=159646 RepID=UPI002FCCCF37